MLPVRIETRFSPDRTALDIRIYPDQVHLDGHEPEFTDDERQAAEWYWEQRWAALDDGDVADQAWQTLAGRFRPGRARYLVETLRPTNIDTAPERVAGRSPTRRRRATSWTRAVEATALPEHWVAVGYQARRGGLPGVVGTAGARPPRRRTDARRPRKRRRNRRTTPSCPRVQDAFRWARRPRRRTRRRHGADRHRQPI